jgi:hypothetical protein
LTSAAARIDVHLAPGARDKREFVADEHCAAVELW